MNIVSCSRPRLTKLLCCRWRSRKLNQRKPQTPHLLLPMVATLGAVLSMRALVDMAVLMGVLMEGLALALLGIMQVLVVGLVVDMGMVLEVEIMGVVMGGLEAVA